MGPLLLPSLLSILFKANAFKFYTQLGAGAFSKLTSSSACASRGKTAVIWSTDDEGLRCSAPGQVGGGAGQLLEPNEGDPLLIP